MTRVFLFRDEHHQGLIEEMKILLVHHIKLLHNIKDIFFYDILGVREEDSNITIMPWGLLFRSVHNHSSDLLFSERFFQSM
jgi:hypothetical protein